MSADGLYHCSVKPVGRANGRSIVAAAAYRSGERLEDERTGEVFDYRARGGVADKFIIAPDNAPSWAMDRAQLWNGAEAATTAKNGRVANEIEVALPCELSRGMRKALLTEFVRDLVQTHGVVADIAIHAPGKEGDRRNHHAHILITHREIGPEGFGEVANTRMQTRRRKDKTGKMQEKPEKIAGIAATPADIKAIRKEWEQFVNRAYERAGLDIRVDHRSHADRGLQDEPTKHLGPTATEMERNEPGSSDRGAIKQETEDRNATRGLLPELEQELAAINLEIGAEVERQAAIDAERDAARSQEAPSLIRMYRGIDPNSEWGEQQGGARHFSTDRERATDFGRLHYVDVTPAEFAKFDHAHSARFRAAEPVVANDYIIADAGIIARLKPLEAELDKQASIDGERYIVTAREAENAPEAKRSEDAAKVFSLSASWTVEPPTPMFDRDAANDAWERKLAEAAIAAEDAAHSARKARQTADRSKGATQGQPTAEGRYAALEVPKPAPEAKPERELGKAAGEIRMAWALSRPDQFTEALEARGFRLACVTREEARTSERVGALAKAVGNFAPVLREGEIVAVNGRDLFQLNERTTGQTRGEIEGRLVAVDPATLLSVADTKEVMREAEKEAYREQQRAAREKARPATWMETCIAECAKEARDTGGSIVTDLKGQQVSEVEALADRLFNPDDARRTQIKQVHGAEAFAAHLNDAGIAIVRVSAADAVALTALRRNEDMARQAAHTNDEAYKPRQFAELVEGDLAAVMKNSGEVHRINPDKLGDAPSYLTGPLPGVVETRARFEIEREKKAELWADRRAQTAVNQGARTAQVESPKITREVGKTARGIEREAQRTIGTGLRAGGRLIGALFKAVETVLEMFDGGDPVLTPAEAKRTEQATKEKTVEAVAENIAMDREARLQELLAQIARDDAQQRLRAYRGEDHDQGRERERER